MQGTGLQWLPTPDAFIPAHTIIPLAHAYLYFKPTHAGYPLTQGSVRDVPSSKHPSLTGACLEPFNMFMKGCCEVQPSLLYLLALAEYVFLVFPCMTYVNYRAGGDLPAAAAACFSRGQAHT
jgi:hypothetical protein